MNILHADKEFYQDTAKKIMELARLSVDMTAKAFGPDGHIAHNVMANWSEEDKKFGKVKVEARDNTCTISFALPDDTFHGYKGYSTDEIQFDVSLTEPRTVSFVSRSAVGNHRLENIILNGQENSEEYLAEQLPLWFRGGLGAIKPEYFSDTFPTFDEKFMKQFKSFTQPVVNKAAVATQHSFEKMDVTVKTQSGKSIKIQNVPAVLVKNRDDFVSLVNVMQHVRANNPNIKDIRDIKTITFTDPEEGKKKTLVPEDIQSNLEFFKNFYDRESEDLKKQVQILDKQGEAVSPSLSVETQQTVSKTNESIGRYNDNLDVEEKLRRGDIDAFAEHDPNSFDGQGVGYKYLKEATADVLNKINVVKEVAEKNVDFVLQKYGTSLDDVKTQQKNVKETIVDLPMNAYDLNTALKSEQEAQTAEWLQEKYEGRAGFDKNDLDKVKNLTDRYMEISKEQFIQSHRNLKIGEYQLDDKHTKQPDPNRDDNAR